MLSIFLGRFMQNLWSANIYIISIKLFEFFTKQIGQSFSFYDWMIWQLDYPTEKAVYAKQRESLDISFSKLLHELL